MSEHLVTLIELGKETARADSATIERLIFRIAALEDRLKEACNLLIGAAAWLESSDQKPIGAGLRKWVAEKSLTETN